MINGRRIPAGSSDRYRPLYQMGADRSVLRYFGVPEDGIELQLNFLDNSPASLRVVSAIEGLPGNNGAAPRPADFMSKPFVPTDMTILTKVLRL